MNLEEREKVYEIAIGMWGDKEQYDMAQEEATELALAVRKYVRKNDDKTYTDMVEEIADVEIMIEQIKLMNRDILIETLIDQQKAIKVKRLKERLDLNSFE